MAEAAQEYRFAPHERPVFPGSPYSPRHSPRRNLAYLISAIVIGLASGLGNGLITVNITTIAGELGLYQNESNWLLVVYVAFSATANLMLVKARIEFGIPRVAYTLLLALLVAELIAFVFPSFGMVLLCRAVAGLTNGGLTSLVLYNLFQVLPPKARPVALMIGFTIPQLAVPIARLFPVENIGAHGWLGLHLVESAMALAAFAALNLVPLPPTDRGKAFEPLDAVTVALVIPAMLLICSVLAFGRYLWWTDTPWLGWALVAAIPLIALAVLVEHQRRNPLLHIRWLGSLEILRFAAIALLIRVALAEQTYGAVGLLTAGGLTNDQLHFLFFLVLLSMIAGTAVAVLLLKPERLTWMVLAATLIIALSAWMDSHATSLTRPEQLYLSQCLVAFGSSLFLGPALLHGFGRMMAQGPTHLVSFVVLFSTTQSIGGLAGSALLGSYQVAHARAHAEVLAERLSLGDPQVVQRVQAGARSLGLVITDPAQAQAQGSALLGQALTREANILAFNDTFRFVMWIALTTALYLVYILILRRFRPLAGPAPAGATP